ncbi:uncharacterized protein LOC134274933 [Saccostrea cucullata]|uniref:uncharacterized protein LOC134274933 n=1 Tax=Saccostrea cuccullata TaxID=36930 RepID=UPI002ED2BA75
MSAINASKRFWKVQKTSETDDNKLDKLLAQVVELSETDFRQNKEISELIIAILTTNENISKLNQSIGQLRDVTTMEASENSDFHRHTTENGDQEEDMNDVQRKTEVDVNQSDGFSEEIPDEQPRTLSESRDESSINSFGEVTKDRTDEELNICEEKTVDPDVSGSIDDEHNSVEETKSEYSPEVGSNSEPVGNSILSSHADRTALVLEPEKSMSEIVKSSLDNNSKESKPQNQESSTSFLCLRAMEDILTTAESRGKLKRRRTQRDFDNRLVVMTEESKNIEQTLDTKTKDLQIFEMKTEYPSLEDKIMMLAKTRRVDKDHWVEESKLAGRKHEALEHQPGGGFDTIFILDTSASMEGDGIKQLKGTVNDILDEFQRFSALDQHVAVITFGKENRFQCYYSNRYYEIKQSIDQLTCDGPSPFGAGLLLSCGARNGFTKVGKWNIRPNIILISDGRPTDIHYPEGPEDPDIYDTNRTLGELKNIVEDLANLDFSIKCVPVGDPDMSTLEMISGLSIGGKIIHLHEARKLGRFPRNVVIASQLQFQDAKRRLAEMDKPTFDAMFANLVTTEEFTQDDKDDIFKILSGSLKELKPVANDQEILKDQECQERDPNMPNIGTRVRRGPDWKWNDHDSHQLGTVTGHSKDPGWLSVEWDTGGNCRHRYGADGCYEVVVCDDPRVLNDELISVGCLVSRGIDWEWGDQDGGAGIIGTVYRVSERAIIHVRWPNGNRNSYRFGFYGKFDVQLCDPFSAEVKEALKRQNLMSSASSQLMNPPSPSKPTTNIDLNKEKEPEKQNAAEEEKMSPEDLKHTGASLNIMDMAPPVKHSVWSDFDFPADISNSFSNRRNRRKPSAKVTATSVKNPNNTGGKEKTHDQQATDSKDRLFGGTGASNDVLNPDVSNSGLSTGGALQKFENEESAPAKPKVKSEEIVNNPSAKSNNQISVKSYISLKDEKDINEGGEILLKCLVTESNDKNKDSSVSTSKRLEDHYTDNKQKTNSFSSVQDSVSATTCWEWKDSSGQWKLYPEDVQDKLREKFLKNPKSTVLISLENSCFRVVLFQGKHINTETKEISEIRRFDPDQVK